MDIKKKKNYTLISSDENSFSDFYNLFLTHKNDFDKEHLVLLVPGTLKVSKKEFLQIISEDIESLETKFETIRESTILKLNTMLEKEDEFEIKTKLSETIEKGIIVAIICDRGDRYLSSDLFE